jgi:hypothetical protein
MYTSHKEMAGPKITWRPGRIDGFEQNATPDGRLPDALQGADHLRSVGLCLYLLAKIFTELLLHRSSTAWGTRCSCSLSNSSDSAA